MATKSFDVLVAKEFETKVNGQSEWRTIWNRVGRAWPGKNGESMGIELFLFPREKYVLHMGERKGGSESQFLSDQPGVENV